MLLLAFDQSSSSSGWAAYETPGPLSKIVCGTIRCPDVPDDEEQFDSIGWQLKRVFGRWKPGFVVWERAIPHIAAYGKKDWRDDLVADDPNATTRWTPNADQLRLPQVEGLIRGVCISYSIGYESVPVRTWRAAVYGKGGGALSREQAKEQAKRSCERENIGFHNEHEAEAAMIALWGARCSQKLKLARFRGAA